MKSRCPRCGRTAKAHAEPGEFLAQCAHCGARMAPHSDEPCDAAPASTRIQRGALAGLLISRTSSEEGEVQVISSHGVAQLAAAPSSRCILRPESRRELARAQARQKALRRAELRGNHQALGAIWIVGLAVVLLLGASALVLKARDMWQHPAPARADVHQLR